MKLNKGVNARTTTGRVPFAIDARGVASATRQHNLTRGVRNTNAFGAHRAPKYKGADEIRVANEDLARRASQEMRRFKRTLPKGVRI